MKIDPSRPNIIMVLIDSLRYDFVKEMPFYDKLIGEGIYFNKMYTYAPYTRGSGHALLSGMYGTRSGMRSWRSSYFKGHRIITLQDYLRGAGYRTYADLAYVLDWPLYGFDMISAFKSHEWLNRMFERHGALLSRTYEMGADESPFFFFFDYSQLHSKHVELRQKGETLTPRIYSQWIRETDEYLEQLFGHAALLGFAQNTIWIILGDHGVGGWEREDEPYYGTYLYDYTVKIPCLMWGMKEKGTIENCVRIIDIQPTIMDFLKIAPLKSPSLILMNGESVLPIVKGKETRRKRLAYFETHSPEWGPWKSDSPNVFGATDGRWKLVMTPEGTSLYDLVLFPKEDKDFMFAVSGEDKKRDKRVTLGYTRLKEEILREQKEGDKYEGHHLSSRGKLSFCPSIP